jgi:UDP-N-acetylglucosamine 2-epimerase (non-hydrolysing)
MKIAVVLGTRPEAIKLAPVILALRSELDIVCQVWLTAQHREMLDPVLGIFGIRPDVDLNLMMPDQSLARFTARCIEMLDGCISRERPDMILVQGDTTTVFCASLAAFYRKTPLAHLEAGLRTGDLQKPWPEEANRVLTSRLAAIHLAPTQSARQNLLHEGVRPEEITVTGNTVIDALFAALKIVQSDRPSIPGLPAFLQSGVDRVETAPRIVLVTGHRRESFGEGFEHICHSIARLARRFPDVHFVYPVHLNPNVREPVMRILGRTCQRDRAGLHPGRRRRSRRPDLKFTVAGNIHLIEPLPYLQFVWLMNRCTLILTDSGGVQEEAPSLGKPVLVMREVTERPEAVVAGTARLVGSDEKKIVVEVSRLLTDTAAYNEMSRLHNPYGDGHASQRVVRACQEYFERRQKPEADQLSASAPRR